MQILEKYKLFFVDRPFTFPGDKTVNMKTAIHRVDNDFLGYFLSRFKDDDSIDEIVSEIDFIISEGFYDPEYCMGIYLDFPTMRYTDISVLFEDIDPEQTLLQEIPFSDLKELLFSWKDFLLTAPFDKAIVDKHSEFQYYLKEYESEEEIVSALVKTFHEVDFSLIKTENIGGYRKEFSTAYSKGKNDEFYLTSLYDNNNRMIYEKEENYFKGESEVIIRKYYFDEQLQYSVELLYDDHGAFSAIEHCNAETPYIYASQIDLIYPGFLSKNPYYKNSDIIP
ncbi:hypothetical protein SAMN05421594_2041 [Chryseobacterium oleae]|uniref:Uncharacterized protein n=1 Tax=Chryseobacterium oleae TaxID=491207 RepID=A0A1I4XRL0_CHROL|nr:hypothetical protein [Chryseobacterium oleae]SFN28326.1 hypothetical protein SAMN05421594_2041 [Chryseobacterium oleae]